MGYTVGMQVQITRISNPGAVLWVSDNGNNTGFNRGTTIGWCSRASISDDLDGNTSHIANGTYRSNYHHNDKVNIVYVDGHVGDHKYYLYYDTSLFHLWDGFKLDNGDAI